MSSSIGWELKIKDGVYKKLSKLPADGRNRIIQASELLPLNPYAGDIEKMKGKENVWRRRIGAYRIFYEIIAAERVTSIRLNAAPQRRIYKIYKDFLYEKAPVFIF